MPSHTDSDDPKAAVESSLDLSEYETQFIPKENDEEELWEIIGIMAETKTKYLVKWAGNDPATGKPWPRSWVPKHDCTDLAIREWKRKQARKKKTDPNRKSGAKGRPSAASSSRASERSTDAGVVATIGRSSSRAASSRAAPVSVSNGSHTSSSKARSSHRKRRQTLADDEQSDVPVSPRKKRKLSVDASMPPPKKRSKRKAVEEVDSEEEIHTALQTDTSLLSSGTRAGRSNEDVLTRDSIADRSSSEQEVIIKIGPPRNVKQAQKTTEDDELMPDKTSYSRLVTKVGPPRRAKGKKKASKRSRTPTSSDHADAATEQFDRPATPTETAVERVQHDDLDVGEPGEVVIHHEDPGFNGNENSYWQYDFDLVPAPMSPLEDIFSLEDIVPETQSPPYSSPQEVSQRGTHAISPEPDPYHMVPPATPPSSPSARQLIPPGSRDSIKSKMKPRTRRGAGDKVLKKISALPNIPILETRPSERSNNNHAGIHEAPAGMRKRSEVRSSSRGPLSVSDRRPRETYQVQEDLHRSPEPEPPLSSIEQFSSPEKGSIRATAIAIERAKQRVKDKGRGGQVPSRRDDETLQIRGRQLAEEAASNRSSSRPLPVDEDGESNDWLFRLSSDPPSPRRAHMQPSEHNSDPDPNDMSVFSETPQEISISPASGAPVEDFTDLYTDYDGGRHVTDVHGLSPSQLEPGPTLSLWPDLPGIRHKLDPLQQVRRSIPESRIKNQVLNEPPLSPATVDPMAEEPVASLPPTTSTQRAVVDSQSMEHSVSPVRLRELQYALEQKTTEVSELEHKITGLQDEVGLLKLEKAGLSEKSSATESQYQAQCQAIVEANARYETLEKQMEELREQHAQNKVELEGRVEEQQITLQKLRKDKEGVEADRDLFREYYGKASSHVSAIADEKADLEQQLNVKISQLSQGLPMLKGMYEERVRRMQEELGKWKALCKVLTDKDERTNDEVRRRAALEPILSESNAELREENSKLQEQLDELRFLAAQDSGISSPVILEHIHHEPDEDGDAEGDDGYSPAEYERDGYVDPEQHLTSSDFPIGSIEQLNEQGEHFMHPVFDEGTAPLKMEIAELDSTKDDVSSYIFACQYVIGTTMCYASFDTAEEVVQHALKTHYGKLQELVSSSARR